MHIYTEHPAASKPQLQNSTPNTNLKHKQQNKR